VYVCVCVCVCVCARACVRACVRARVRACVRQPPRAEYNGTSFALSDITWYTMMAHTMRYTEPQYATMDWEPRGQQRWPGKPTQICREVAPLEIGM
jgi:hypothetical protein